MDVERVLPDTRGLSFTGKKRKPKVASRIKYHSVLKIRPGIASVIDK